MQPCQCAEHYYPGYRPHIRFHLHPSDSTEVLKFERDEDYKVCSNSIFSLGILGCNSGEAVHLYP